MILLAAPPPTNLYSCMLVCAIMSVDVCVCVGVLCVCR